MNRIQMLSSLIITLIVLSATVIIARMWGVAFVDDYVLAKTLGSFFVAGFMAAFAVMILYDFDGHKMKKLLTTLLILAEGLGALVLLQLWAHIMDWWTFTKVAGTVIVIGGVVAFIMAAVEDLDEDKDLKKRNFLD